MANEAQGFYDDPAVYDILHSPGTGKEVDVLERLHARHLPSHAPEGLWMEPACGSGRFLRVLVGRGHAVAGFDKHPEMIRYARQRLRAAATGAESLLQVADMTRFSDRFPPGRVVLAFNTINTIRHLPDDEAFLAHFEEMARVLRPDGIYVVGLSLSAYELEEASEDVWRGARGRCEVRQVVQYLPADRQGRMEQVFSHLAITRPGGVETRDDSYGLRAFNRKQWRALVRRSPLSIAEVTSDRGESMQDHDGNYFLYVLRRAG